MCVSVSLCAGVSIGSLNMRNDANVTFNGGYVLNDFGISNSAEVTVTQDGAYVIAKYRNGTFDSGVYGIDDTRVLQSAADGVTGRIVVGSGLFTISGHPLNVTGGDWLDGQGNSTIFKAADDLDMWVIGNKNVVDNVQIDNNVTLSNFVVDGDGANQTASLSFGVYFRNMDNVNIYGLNIYNTYSYSICMTQVGFGSGDDNGITNSSIHNNIFRRNVASYPLYDCVVITAKDTKFYNNYVENQHGAGFTTSKLYRCDLFNNIIRSTDIAVAFESWSNSSFTNVYHNIIDPLSSGVTSFTLDPVGMPGGWPAQVHDINIHHNTCLGNGGYALFVYTRSDAKNNPVYNINFNDNEMNCGVYQSVYLGYRMHNSTIARNKFYHTGDQPSIRLDGNSDINIEDNTVLGGGFGVRWMNATSYRISMTGNKIKNSYYTGIGGDQNCLVDSTISQNFITNPGVGNVQYYRDGILLYRAQNCTVSFNVMLDNRASPTMESAIRIASSEYNVIMGNTQRGATGVTFREDGPVIPSLFVDNYDV